MATTVYGNVITGTDSDGNTRKFRAYATYEVTSTATATTIKITAAGVQSTAGSMRWAAGRLKSKITGAISVAEAANTSEVSLSGNTTYAILTNKSSSAITRTTSAQTKTVTVTMTGVSPSAWKGASSLTISFTVPALASYTVTYNANGGSGAPASQTKYYGKALTLSKTTPTRDGYLFKSWNTKADGSGTSYANTGVSYSVDVALSLYAQWQVEYTAMTISNISVVRYDGTAAETNESGTRALLTFNYTRGKTYTATGTATSIDLTIKIEYYNGSKWVTQTTVTKSADGSVSQVCGSNGTFNVNNTYQFRITLTDAKSSITVYANLSSAFFTVDVTADGKAVCFGGVAVDGNTGNYFATDIYFTVDQTAGSATVDGRIVTALKALGWDDELLN